MFHFPQWIDQSTRCLDQINTIYQVVYKVKWSTIRKESCNQKSSLINNKTMKWLVDPIDKYNTQKSRKNILKCKICKSDRFSAHALMNKMIWFFLLFLSSQDTVIISTQFRIKIFSRIISWWVFYSLCDSIECLTMKLIVSDIIFYSFWFWLSNFEIVCDFFYYSKIITQS